MRKIQIIGLALVAVFALGAMTASSSLALSKILVAGAEPANGTPFQITGEWLLEDTGAPGPPDIQCSGIFDGVFESGVLGLITELLTLAGVLLAGATETIEETSEIRTRDLIEECTDLHSPAICSSPVDVEVGRLPWHVEVILDNSLQFLLVFLEELDKTPIGIIHCKSILGELTDECSGWPSARLFTSGTALLGSFNKLALTETWGAESPNLSCSIGGANATVLESPGDTEAAAWVMTSSSGALTLSE